MEFVLIEAGTFEMGSPTTEPGRDDERNAAPGDAEPAVLSGEGRSDARAVGSGDGEQPVEVLRLRGGRVRSSRSPGRTSRGLLWN